MSGRGSVKIVSWNVGSLTGPVKWTRVFSHLKHLNAHIMFIQETHLHTTDHKRLSRPWIGHIFHSMFNLKTRGTAILMNKKVNFIHSSTVCDPNGWFIIVTSFLYQIPVVLISVYAPNWDGVAFMKKLIPLIPDLRTDKLIFGGDINCVMDPCLDRSSSKTATQSKMSQTFAAFMAQCGSVDPWRISHPTTKQYSFYSHAHIPHLCIDYFL